MNTIDLKSEVAAAVRDEWPAFAARHPRLAAVLDETLLVEQAVASIRDDPDYREAMETAATVGAGCDVVAAIVRRLVGRMIRTIV